MQSVMRTILWLLLAVILGSGAFASGTGFHGIVTDNTGKPIRGAMIKVTAGGKIVPRFTHTDEEKGWLSAYGAS